MTYRKIVITVCLLCLSLVGFAQFDTWIVDNNLQSPTGSHIFSDLSAAITVAAVGDVIYVKASPTPYANSIINKGITIVGEGFKGQAATIDQLTIGMDASNTAIHGLKITDQLVFNSAVGIDLSNILISYNFIEEILWNSGGTTDSIRNLDIQSNIIGSGQMSAGTEALYLNLRTAGTLFIENNVFFGSTSSGASIRASGVFISRNAFIGTGTEKAFDHISNCSVSSNIFFGRSAEAMDGTSSENSFSNNYAFSTLDDTFANVIGVIGTACASPNSNTDPRLVNIILSTAWDFDLFTIDYDFQLIRHPLDRLKILSLKRANGFQRSALCWEW